MTEILIYGIVGDEWDALDAKTLVPRISAGDDDLDVRINSPGGYVMEGLAIFNALGREKAKGRKVTTHIDGLAASMASVLAMAGDEILMADNALMMIHPPWDVAIGDAVELRAAADKLDLLRDQLVRIYSAQTGIDAETLVKMLDAETWLTSEQALEQKFVTQVVEASSAAACDVTAFGFRRAPKTSRISAMATIGKPKAAPPAPPAPQEKMMNFYTTRAALVAAISKFQAEGGTQEEIDKIARSAIALDAQDALPATGALAQAPAPAGLTAADVQAAVATERARVSGIRALGTKHKLPTEFIDELVAGDTTLAVAREKILDKLAEAGDAQNVGHNSPAVVTQDARDKFREGATNWLLVKAGVAPMIEAAAKLRGETIRLDPGEFRGVRNADLAREALAMAGVRFDSRNPDAVVREAMIGGARGYQTQSDFPVLFETALHKILQAAYATTPDTWSRFCGTGSVTDFRSTSRYLKGTFGSLDQVNEHGEFKNKVIPDLAKELIQAKTVGNIVGLTRQAIVNDNEMEIFSGLATDLGRAAKLTIEVDVYALLNSNPTMNDGNALFSSAHGNLASPGVAPSVAAFDAIRVAMGSQKDLSNNEFLDIRPSVIVAPLSLGGSVRRVNAAQYDPDVTSKFQVPNIVNGLFNDVVDTPRLTGTAYYAFADPNLSPTIEVVFLNGVTEPYSESQDGWRIDGVEWKIRHDYGVGAINWRSGYKQPGA
jgi:ATP-dependent Clp endopeptidase proteolytic subunit ClpP